MARTVGIGHQDFETVRKEGIFYIDKTDFIRQWWEAKDQVTLITRPRRFGKTLNMSTLEKFFPTAYAGRGDLLEGLSIWEDETYRLLQGTYPVISLSFAGIKEGDYGKARRKICEIIASQYAKREFLLEGNLLAQQENEAFRRKTIDMDDVDAFTKDLDKPNSSACFYHGFVLGLMVELSGRYALTSNRESGFGRYDVTLEPLNREDDAMILEFKAFQPKKEKNLEETAQAALAQIEKKHYAAALEAKGIPQAKIRKYGFAFEGSNVLIQGN